MAGYVPKMYLSCTFFALFTSKTRKKWRHPLRVVGHQTLGGGNFFPSCARARCRSQVGERGHLAAADAPEGAFRPKTGYSGRRCPETFLPPIDLGGKTAPAVT